MLRQRLFVQREIMRAIVLIQLQYTGHFALRQHGDEQQTPGRFLAVPGAHGKGTAIDIGDDQKRAVVEAGHGAGLGPGGRRRKRDRSRFGAFTPQGIQRLGGAVVNE